ncbi:MAG: acyl-CoA dehydrogenase family protein, partial [Spirochaetota bacterium]|nr:acyl-CoA dehydrogenase family protein [Spirochaetota bacterium]
MDFELTSEHLMLKESVASFIKNEHSFDRLRELKGDKWGYSKDVWKKMADLGWMGFIYPEDYGGLGLDFGFVMVLLEEMGKGMLPEPWISSVLLGGNIALLGGTDVQKKNILPKIVEGDLFITAAYMEDEGRYDLNYCGVTAKKCESGFLISGKKIFVLDGCSADAFIVSARTSGNPFDKNGISLFLLPCDSKGLGITSVKTMDGRNACVLELKDVFVAESDMIGEFDKGYPILNKVIDQATAGLCAEMVGGMQAVLDMTVQYISEREQFNKPIGSFQALQHKASDMLIQKELAMSASYYAIASIDENSDESALAVSVAKAKCSMAYLEVTKTSLQLTGGFGFTNEADFGFFLKRAKVAETLFGDA